MRIVTHLLAAIIAAVIVFLFLTGKTPEAGNDCSMTEILHARQAVEKQIGDISGEIARRLAGFGAAVSQDREFSMKLLVEHDTWSPEVTEIAGRYMSAMGLSVLDVTDSALTVLSSGHFSGRAGTSAMQKAFLSGDEAVCLIEDVNGEQVPTFQSGALFTCVDIPFHCFGGIVIDNALLSRLSPWQGVQVLFKHGNLVLGMDSVATISGITDNQIVINDITYLASSFPVSTSDSDMESAEILVVMLDPGEKLQKPDNPR
jgi:hypothetical protein